MAKSRRCLWVSGLRYYRQGTRRARPQTDGRTALGEGPRRLLVVSDGARTAGSPAGAQQNAGIAEAAELSVWLQIVGLGLGVSGTFGTHVHAVIKNATIPSDSLHFVRENDLIYGALTPKDGFVEVPTTPGLGIELDMDAVEKYRIA